MTDDDLSGCVRAWRERLDPAAAGFPAGRARRTPGLRREELAALAGVSVDYLVRLEQGRSTNPSPQVLASLARALRLTVDERDHLYRLARQAPPARGQVPTHLPPGVSRLIARLPDAAVSVYDAMWTLVTWNATWAALMGDASALSGRDRNLPWRHFVAGGPHRMVRDGDDVDAFERSAVADLRAVSGRYPDDPRLRALVADLRAASPRFAARWEEAEVAVKHADRKTVRHPEVGDVTVDCDVLTVAGSDLRIIVYTAEPGTPDADRLDLVRVIGLQRVGVDGHYSR